MFPLFTAQIPFSTNIPVTNTSVELPSLFINIWLTYLHWDISHWQISPFTNTQEQSIINWWTLVTNISLDDYPICWHISYDHSVDTPLYSWIPFYDIILIDNLYEQIFPRIHSTGISPHSGMPIKMLSLSNLTIQNHSEIPTIDIYLFAKLFPFIKPHPSI